MSRRSDPGWTSPAEPSIVPCLAGERVSPTKSTGDRQTMIRRFSCQFLLALVLAAAGTGSVRGGISFRIASGPDLPEVPSPESYLRSWLFLGPFAFPEEARETEWSDGWKSDPIDAASIRSTTEPVTVDGGAMVWRELPWDPAREKSDLAAVLDPKEYAIVYLATWIFADEPADRHLLLGSDDGIVVWLNGERVHENYVCRPCTPDEDDVTVHLRQGANLLVMKIIQGAGGWQFSARFDDNRGLRVAASGDPARASVLFLPRSPEPGRPPGIVAGPYLQNMTSGAVTIFWQTDVPSTGRLTLYTEEGAVSADAVEARRLHEIRVAGLEADTTYPYAVTAAVPTDPETRSRPRGSFLRTFPAEPRSVRVLVYGDTRSHPERQVEVVAAMLREPDADAVIHTGDIIADGLKLGQWIPEFFEPSRPLLATLPVFFCLGNHERNSPYYYQYFDNPDSGEERWYSFDVGPVHFSVIDSNAEYGEGSEQYRWLKADLERNRDKPWKILYGHHPTYSSGPHGRLAEDGRPAEGAIRTAQDLFPGLAEEYGISIFFAGHDHFYERSENRGVHYVICGGGGAPSYPQVDDAERQNPYSKVFYSDLHYIVLTADSHRLEMVAKTPAGKIIDRVVLNREERDGPPPGGDIDPSTD